MGLYPPKATDFGCARWEDGEISTQGFALLGTPSHMAPEVFEHGSKEHDARADLWSLGVMLYHLLSGQLPFADDPRTEAGRAKLMTEDPSPIRSCPKAVPGVDDRLEAIVAKTLAKKPADRYQTAAELAEELKGWVTLAPMSESPATQITEAVRTRFRVRVAAAVLTAVLLLAGVTLALTLWPRSTPPTDASGSRAAATIPLTQRLRAPGDTVEFVGASGPPIEQVGPVSGFVGTSTLGPEKRCELGAVYIYLFELFREELPFPFVFEADVAIGMTDGTPRAGIYAAENPHPQPGAPGTPHIAYAVGFGPGPKAPPRMQRSHDEVFSSPVKFTHPDGTLNADLTTMVVPFHTPTQRVPADEIPRDGKAGLTHHLAIEVAPSGFKGFRDGRPINRLDDKDFPGVIGPLQRIEGFRLNGSLFGPGYGLFVHAGAAQFQNVRLTRLSPR